MMIRIVNKDYNPNQKRDRLGRWAEVGGGNPTISIVDSEAPTPFQRAKESVKKVLKSKTFKVLLGVGLTVGAALLVHQLLTRKGLIGNNAELKGLPRPLALPPSPLEGMFDGEDGTSASDYMDLTPEEEEALIPEDVREERDRLIEEISEEIAEEEAQHNEIHEALGVPMGEAVWNFGRGTVSLEDLAEATGEDPEDLKKLDLDDSVEVYNRYMDGKEAELDDLNKELEDLLKGEDDDSVQSKIDDLIRADMGPSKEELENKFEKIQEEGINPTSEDISTIDQFFEDNFNTKFSRDDLNKKVISVMEAAALSDMPLEEYLQRFNTVLDNNEDLREKWNKSEDEKQNDLWDQYGDPDKPNPGLSERIVALAAWVEMIRKLSDTDSSEKSRAVIKSLSPDLLDDAALLQSLSTSQLLDRLAVEMLGSEYDFQNTAKMRKQAVIRVARLMAGRKKSMKIRIVDKAYNPNQKRDRLGRWTEVGAGIGALTGAVAGAGVGLVAGSQARQKLPPGAGSDQLGVLGLGGGWIAGSLVGGGIGKKLGLKTGKAYDRIASNYPKTKERLNKASDNVVAFAKSPKVQGLLALGIGLAPLIGFFAAASQDRSRESGSYSSGSYSSGGGDRSTSENFDKKQGRDKMSTREKMYAEMYDTISKSDGAKEAAETIDFMKEEDSKKSKITTKSGDEEEEVSETDFLAALLVALEDSPEEDVLDFMAEQILGDDYDDGLEGEEREEQRLQAVRAFASVIESADSAAKNSTKIRIVSRMR